MQTKRPSIVDVASLAKVSKQTVSRVINDSPNVSDRTRERVLAAIAELGFRRSELARSFSSGRTYSLGVVGRDIGYFGSRTYLGMVQEAQSLGYSLLHKEIADSSLEQVEAVLHALVDRQVDGIIWTVPEIADNHAWLESGLFSSLAVPVVFLSMTARPGLNVVAFDNAEGARLATQHLIDKGRRHIGHISGPLDWLDASERMQGWESVLKQAGLPAQPEQVESGAWSAATGHDAMARLLQKYPEIDAVFVANDRMALGALLAIHEKGLRVPEDIAVIGFDGISDGAFFHPPLSTVRQDKGTLGRLAVEVLANKIESRFAAGKQTQPDWSVLQHQLLVRNST